MNIGEVNIGTEFPDLGTLIVVIAHSQIVVEVAVPDRRRLPEQSLFPPGFGDADIAVLEWIAAEGCRVGREIARI